MRDLKKIIRKISFIICILVVFSGQSVIAGTYAATKYPIMLVHGVSGFDKLLGFYEYWYRMPESLRSEGAIVRSAQVSAWNSTAQRGEELIKQIQQFLAETKKEKVNLIGHSHGSVTCRYAMYMRPDLVASVTTIAGVHKGTPIADFLFETPSSVQGLATSIIELEGQIIYFLTGQSFDQNAKATMYDISTKGIAEFNAKYPCAGVPTTKYGEGAYSEKFDYNGKTHEVKYFSYTGAKSVTNIFDPLEWLFGTLGIIIKYYGNESANDGAVPSYSARFGQVIRADYPWNHADEVNQVLGIRGLFTSDPVSVIRSHANRLKNAGL